jgi:hypothetical protein
MYLRGFLKELNVPGNRQRKSLMGFPPSHHGAYTSVLGRGFEKTGSGKNRPGVS